MTLGDKKAFVENLEKQHGQRLRRFLASKLRHCAADVPDLVQEVFLRLLRINNHETIRSSEAYLFTVAFHVLLQHVMRRSAIPESVEITTLIDQMESASDTDPISQLQTQQQLEELQHALQQLPPKAQAVLLLHRRDGYSLEEIAGQLGFSRANAAKYLAKALVHCRQHMQEKSKDAPMNMQIYDEASEWIVRHRTDSLDADSKRRFDSWLRESPQHVRAYLELSSIWEGVPELDINGNSGPDELIARARVENNVHPLGEFSPERKSAPATRRPRAARMSLAASLIIAVGIASWTYLQRDVYSTDTGEQRTIALADGSSVELNTLSKIKVNYTDSERSIDLLKGQALFRVAKDPNRPFIVESNGTLVRAVGTQFDVYWKGGGTVVTVVEGRVAVRASKSDSSAKAANDVPSLPERRNAESPEQGSADRASTIASGHTSSLKAKVGEVLLVAGEQLLVAQVVPEPKLADIEAVTAWTKQRLVFDFTPLTEVAEEFNRYNRRPLVIEDASLRSFLVSGSFSSTDPAVLLKFLRDQPGINLNETATEIRISRAATESI